MTDPCLARFLDEDAVEGALRLTPEVGVDLPLVAGDMKFKRQITFRPSSMDVERVSRYW
jgi:hypothetical protein